MGFGFIEGMKFYSTKRADWHGTPIIVARAGYDYHLSIVHTNDSHSEIASSGSIGGSARIATMSRRLRNQRQNVLMQDAGDQFQRTDFNSIIHEANTLVVNLLNYDSASYLKWTRP